MKYIGAGSAVGLAGCSGDGGDGGDGGTGTPTSGGDGDVPDPDPNFGEEGSDVPNRNVGGTFVAASTSTASQLNPINAGDDGTTSSRLSRLFDLGGFAIGPETFAGYWFEDFEMSDDFQKATYTVRDGLEWGGGYGAVDAETYVYMLNNLILLTGDEDWYAHTRTDFLQVGPDNELISFEKTGDLTFEAELPVPKPQWLHEDPLPGIYMAPKDILQEYVPNQDKEGLDNDEDLTNGVLSEGNLGPYQFVEWQRDSAWTYERNPDYYMKDVDDDVYDGYNQYYDFSDSPYFENYEVQLFDESSTAISSLQTGEVNAAGIGTRKVENIRGSDGITLWEKPFDTFHGWLNLNHRINGWDPIGDSTEVRYALANIYDPSTVVQEVYQGNSIPMATFHPAWGPYYPPEDQLFVAEGSIENAREQLESGTSSDYGYDSNGQFIGPDGNQVELKGVRTTGNEAVELEAQYMQSRLSEAGISLNVEAQDWFSLLGNYAVNSASNVDGVDEADYVISQFNGGPPDQAASAAEWDLMFGLGFGAGPYSPWSTVKSTCTPRGTFNLWGIDLEGLDLSSNLTDASIAESPEQTQELMTEAFSFLSEKMPLVWSNSGIQFVGYTDDVMGFPGEPKEWGFEAQSYFEFVSSNRLLGFRQQG